MLYLDRCSDIQRESKTRPLSEGVPLPEIGDKYDHSMSMTDYVEM